MPEPLFEKIEQDRLNELKTRYGGSQGGAEIGVESEIQNVDIAEKAVAMQSDKVRTLKATKAEKCVVQEQVKILLDLKKVLENLRKESA